MRKVIILFLLLSAIELLAVDGTVIQTSFISEKTGKLIPFSIYLPPNYANKEDRYPLIFHLHGIGGTHNGNQITTVPESFEKALNNGLIGNVIIVFPDGFKDAFWSDSKNSDKPAETNLIYELLPYIKSRYRISDECVAIQGFSMGGFGASKIFSKYPDIFKALISYDGAFLNIDGMIKFHNALWKEIFDEDSSYFKVNSPWEFFRSNSESIVSKPIRILKGSLGYNVDFNTHLIDLNYNHDYVETGCDHVLKCLLDSEGDSSWAAISKAFQNCVSTNIVDPKNNFIFSTNPASDYIEINVGNNDRCSLQQEIRIFNTFGECVIDLTPTPLLTGEGLRIDVSHLPAGIYFVRVGDKIRKFVMVI